MQYHKIQEAVFLRRPNRFIAEVRVNGREETVHVKNTGRCRELLVPGCRVWLEQPGGTNRKTKYDLVTVEKCRSGKAPLLINMDSQAPNAAVEEFLKNGPLFSSSATVRREVVFGESRFDFYVEDGERKCFLEVKGVTLEENGIVLFPDAPTERGAKHLRELIRAQSEGYEAAVFFLIQMKGIRLFRPNAQRDPAFAEALRDASKAGVRILAYDARITPDSMTVDQPVPVSLGTGIYKKSRPF